MVIYPINPLQTSYRDRLHFFQTQLACVYIYTLYIYTHVFGYVILFTAYFSAKKDQEVLSKDLSSPGHRQKTGPDPRDDFPESTLQGRDKVKVMVDWWIPRNPQYQLIYTESWSTWMIYGCPMTLKTPTSLNEF